MVVSFSGFSGRSDVGPGVPVDAVGMQIGQQIGLGLDGSGWIHTDHGLALHEHHRLRQAPAHNVQVQSGKARRLGAGAEALQGVARLFQTSQAFDHGVQLVDREIGLAVDLPIIGLGEEVAHRLAGHAVERRAGNGAGVPEGGVVAFSGEDIK